MTIYFMKCGEFSHNMWACSTLFNNIIVFNVGMLHNASFVAEFNNFIETLKEFGKMEIGRNE